MDQKELDQAIAALVADLDAQAGLNESAVLYGSAARGDWVAGRSDVNVLLVVDDPSPAALSRLTPAVTDWHNRGLMPPLIIGRAEWAAAADVFPIEITDMQLAHRVLRGSDPISGMRVDPSDLRRALESDLRGKLMRLRQAHVRFGDAAPILGGFATASISSLVVLLRCTATLMGRAPGRTPDEVIAVLATELGPNASVVAEIAKHRRDHDWSCPAGTFVRYLDVVHRAVDLVDRLSSDHNPHGDR
jgi:hypothetical protein